MPTYAYECQSCGHKFEKFQSMTAKVLRKCPECSESKLARLIGTGAAIIFKGSGFYSTDYRSSSYKSDEKADTGSGSGSDSKSSTPSSSNGGPADCSGPCAGNPGGTCASSDAAKK